MSETIRAYQKHKNLKLAAAELGMPWQTLYVHLRRAGVAVTGDKQQHGSDKDRLAALAESEFQKLVPFAVDQNARKFQAKCDFYVGFEKVDVKASNLRRGSRRFHALRWSFSVKKQEFSADFIVCFAMLGDGQYRTLLIPGELVRNYQTVSIPQTGKSKWLEYEVAPSALADFFRSLPDKQNTEAA